MKNSLLNISGKLDKSKVDVIRTLKCVFETNHWEFFIVGALARDIILEHAYGLESKRATQDIDFAISVETEDQFLMVRQTLIKEGAFEKTDKWHRLISADGILIDILPFSVESGKMDIYYPSEGGNDPPITMLGFADCYHNSIPIVIEEEALEVKVVSLEGLIVLKIIAWEENFSRREKDAQDIYFIIENYLYAGILEKIEGKDADILKNNDFLFASAIYLGKGIAQITTPKTRDMVVGILKNADRPDENKIVNCLFSAVNVPTEEYDHICKVFSYLLKGIEKH